MSDYEFTLPLKVMLYRSTKADRKFSVDLNAFRSAHHRTYTEAKRAYSKHMKDQLEGFDMITGNIHVHYDYYAQSVTEKRAPDLDNFCGAAKKFFQDAMVNHKLLKDDNVNFIVSNSEKYCGIDKGNPRIVAKVTVLD